MNHGSITQQDLAILSQTWNRDFIRVGPWIMRACRLAELEEKIRGKSYMSFLKAYSPSHWIFAEPDPILPILSKIASGRQMGIAAPLPTSDGALSKSIVLNGEIWQVCVFKAALGRDLAYEVNDMRRFGRALALLHTGLLPYAAAPFRRIDVAIVCRDTCDWLRNAGAEPSLMASVIEQLASELASAIHTDTMTTGLCHGDAWLQNAKLHGECVTFFDFDEYVKGPLALDLAKSTLWLQTMPDGQRLWNALLKGYSCRGALKAADLAAMPALALLSFIRLTLYLARYCTMPDDLWRSQYIRLQEWIEIWRGGVLFNK